MKKKNKIIWGAISAISIGALIGGSSLACVEFKTDKKDSNPTKASAKSVSNLNSISSSNNMSTVSYNDHAYVQTINQAVTKNPQGSSWTKKDALQFTNKNINTMIKMYGIAYILRWNLIQNLNYSLVQYLDSISQQQFTIGIVNFNYAINNITNNDNLQNFRCSIDLNIQFKVTSKNNGATLTFSNNYVYNNVAVSTNVINNGKNAYAYLILTNTFTNSLIPNSVSYCNHASISGDWNNNDFTNLQTLNWLPINSSTTITTSNYQGMLTDSCTRSFNNDTNQSFSQQAQFINLINTQQLYTFNIGFNFGQLNDVVIDVVGQNPTNNNVYTFNYNSQVTLAVDFANSTIISGDSNVYQWMESDPSDANASAITIANANSSTYQFSCYKSYKYYLQVTLPNGKTITSNPIIIEVNTSALSIQNLNENANSNENVYDAQYGSNVTLSANADWQNISDVNYIWEEYNNNTKKFEAIQGAPNSSTYSFNAVSNEVYQLIISARSGSFTITSVNSYTIVIKNNTIALSALNASGQPYANDQAIPYGSSVKLVLQDASSWQNISGLTYTWYEVVGATTLNMVQSTQTYEPLNIDSLTNAGNYELKITDPSNAAFGSLSASIDLGIQNTQLAIALSSNSIANSSVSKQSNGTYDVIYGTQVTLQISSSYWNDVNNSNYVYQWYKYTENPATTTWSFQPINGANQKTYTPPLNDLSGIYRLQITDLANANFALSPSNEITLVSTQDDCTIQTNITNFDGYLDYGKNLTLSLDANSYWDTHNSNLIYTWYKQGDATAVGTGVSLSITNAKTANAGDYYLVITNKNISQFSITSNSITVNVGNPKLTIQLEGNSQTEYSYQLQNAYSFNYGQQVTLEIDSNNSSMNIANSSNQFQWQWGYMTNHEFTEVGHTDFGTYSAISKYALFLSNLYPDQNKTGITYQLVMKEDGSTSTNTVSNTITIIPNSDSSYLQLQVENVAYNSSQDYQITYGNNATLAPYGYYATSPSDLTLTYQWTNESGQIIGTDATLPINYLTTSATDTLTITCSKIPGFKLTSTITVTPTSNLFNLNIASTYGMVNKDNLVQNSLTTTYGTYLYLNVLNLQQYDLYDSFQYEWKYVSYVNGAKQLVSLPGANSSLSSYAFITQKNIQIELIITSNKVDSSQFELQSYPLSISVVNTSVNANVYQGKNAWTTSPDSSKMINNNGGNNYFLNYAQDYTIGLNDYWNNPNTNVSDGFNEIYENGLTYTWTSDGKVIQTSSTSDADFNPWLQISSFASSAIYTLTITGTIKSSLPENLPQPQNIASFTKLTLTTLVILNVENSAISIAAVTATNGPVSEVNEGTYNVIYGYIPSVQTATKYFVQNKSDYTFEWFLNDSTSPYKSGVGLTQITLPNPILTNGSTVQLKVIPTQGGNAIASQIITFNTIDSSVEISGYAGENNSANRSSTQVNANYSENTYLSPTPSTSSNPNFWANSDATTYFSGLKYTWYQVTGNGILNQITNNDTANTSTLVLNPTQDEMQYTLVITDPNISSTFKIISTTTITVNVSYSLIQIQASNLTPKYGDAVTLSLTKPYWTNVSYQWYYNKVAKGNEVPNNSTSGINNNTSTSASYEFVAQKNATYILQITWTENGKQYELTSNTIAISVQDTALALTGSGTNPDGSNVSFPSLNGLNEYDINCWYGASNLSFTPSGYWASVSGATYQWQVSTDNGTTWSNATNGTNKTYKLSYAFNESNLYRLVLTYNGLSITSGVITFSLSNENISIAATYNNETSTSTSDAITVPFGAPFTLSVTGAWASSKISTDYTYTWYYGTTTNQKGIEIGTGSTITVLGNDVKSYNGTSLPTANSSYSYYCIITNSNWNATNDVTATTTPTVNITNVTPQLNVQSIIGETTSVLSPQNGTAEYLTNYGEQIQLNINNYGWSSSKDMLSWSFGTINSISWFVQSNGNSSQLSPTTPSFNFYSLTNEVAYYVEISGTLTNGTAFTVKSDQVSFSLQQTSLALSVSSGSTSTTGTSNSIISGKNTAYVVKYGSMQIITPSSYWINYFSSNSSLTPTYTWTYNDGNGSWTTLTNNLNQTTNQYQFAQFFTNGLDGGVNEGAYQLSVKYNAISQLIPSSDGKTQTVYFNIGTEQPIVIEVVGGTLAISATGKGITLNSTNSYSYVYGSQSTISIESGKVDWSNPTFITNNSQYAPTNNNLSLSYAWYYGSSVHDLALTKTTSNNYTLTGSNGFCQLIITATNSSNSQTIFTLTSNVIQLTVSENTIAIANNTGTVSGTYNYSFGQNTPLQLDPTNYWATNPTGNTYQWYCSTSPIWDANNIYSSSNPNGTIFALNTSAFDASSSAPVNVFNSATGVGSLYGPNNLNLYGSGNGQTIKCTPCYAINTKIYYWLQLTNSNWSQGTPALLSNPILINPINNTVTIGSYNSNTTTNSTSSTDWYNSSNSYQYAYGDKVTMAVDSDKTSLPTGVSYNWQIYTGDTVYATSSASDATQIYNPSGFYDIIAGTSSDSSTSTSSVSASDYDTNPTTSNYWLNLLGAGTYRLRVTINNVSIYSNPIKLSIEQGTNAVSLQSTGIPLIKDNLSNNQTTTSKTILNAVVGSTATVQLITNQYWLSVFNNTTGTGPSARSYYNWTVNWTNTVDNKMYYDQYVGENLYFDGTATGSFSLTGQGTATGWTMTWGAPSLGVGSFTYNQAIFTTTSPLAISWDNGTITIPNVVDNFSFTLTITPKNNCVQYTPFQSYYFNNNLVSPTATSFSLVSNTINVDAAGSFISLQGKSLTNYTLDNVTSTNSFASGVIDVPFLSNVQLEIPGASATANSDLDSSQLADWWWMNEAINSGKVNGKKLYDIALFTVGTNNNDLSIDYLMPSYTKVYDFTDNETSSWTSLITANQTYAIGVGILNSSGTVVNWIYSSSLNINCFADASSLSVTPSGISATNIPNVYSMDYIQLINNPIEFDIANNWTYLQNSTSITEIKTYIYTLSSTISSTTHLPVPTTISLTDGEWFTSDSPSTWTNPDVPIYQGGLYYVEIDFYDGSTLEQSITNTNTPITIDTSFNSGNRTSLIDNSFSINSDLQQGTNPFDTSIAKDNDEYSYNFNSFVNWQTNVFASNGTDSTSNTNPYALVRTVSSSDLANVNYYGNYFVNPNDSKLTIQSGSTTPLYTAINFAIQYEPSGATTWTTYGKAVTFAANLLPSGSDYWDVITNYWLMQNASETGELGSGINGFNPFAWVLGSNSNNKWRVQATVELSYDGVDYSYDAPSGISSTLANQFVFTSSSWQFNQNSTNLTLNITNSSGTTVDPSIDGTIPIYTLNGNDEYSLGFTTTPNISWNTAISDQSINPFSNNDTMDLTNPLLLNVQILYENNDTNSSWAPTSYSWTNPNVSTTNPYGIYKWLFNNWENNTLTSYSLTNITSVLNSNILNSGFYEVQFEVLDVANTWLMNANANENSSSWSFNNLDTMTFSTNEIYINSTSSATNIVINPSRQNALPNWLNISRKIVK